MLGNSIFGSLLSQIPPVPFNSSIAINPSMNSNNLSSVNVIANGNMLPFSMNSVSQQSQYGLQLQNTPAPQQQMAQHFHHSTISPHQISQHPQFVAHQMQPQQQQTQPQSHHQPVHLVHHQQQAQPQHMVQTQSQPLNNMKNMTLMTNFMNTGVGHVTNVSNSVSNIYPNNSGGHLLMPSNQQHQPPQQPIMGNNILPNTLSTTANTTSSSVPMQNGIHTMLTISQQPQQQQLHQLQPPSQQSASINGISLPHLNSGLSSHHQSSTASADSKSLSYVAHSIESTIDQVVTHTIPSANDLTSGKFSSPSKQNKSSKESGSYICNLCSKSYRYRHSLKQHTQQVHLNHKPFSCSECGASFKRKQQLQRHMQSGHHNDQSQSDQLQLPQQQQSTPHGNEEPPLILGETTSYHCPHCSHMFQTQDVFLLHLRTNHMKPVKNVIYHCEFCEHHIFRNKTSLVRHRRKEHPDHEFPRYKQFIPLPTKKECDQPADSNVSTDNNGSIGSSSAPSAVMSTPETNHFGSNGPHTCTACGKRFVNRYGLRRHERIHTGERPHECEVCGLSFMEKSHMKQHQMTHTGETLFHCDVCKRGFNRKYSYQRHLLWHAKGITVPFDEEEENVGVTEHLESVAMSTTVNSWGNTSNIESVARPMSPNNFSSYQLPVTSGGSFTMQLVADAT